MSEPRLHRLIVDRLEGEMVVVELAGGGTIDLPRWMLPPELREGDVIAASAGRSPDGWRVETRVDPAATEERRSSAREALDRLASSDPGGDIQL